MMRKIAGCAMAFALVLASACATTAQGVVNLVGNPGCEDRDPADVRRPAGFTPGHAGKEQKARLTWESPGFRSRKCVAVETMNSDDLGYWETVVPVKPKTEYVVSFRYKCRAATAGKTTGDPAYNQGRPGGPNLELGVVPRDPSQAGKPTNWSDIGIALGPVGGTYLPLATEWSYHRQTVTTASGQTQMKVKLRVYCYTQKVWFDDLSVMAKAALPQADVSSPGARDKTWSERDTTPPSVFRPVPLPNANVSSEPTVSARFSDSGAGIDPTSARILLDGKDVTATAKATSQGITLRPAKALAKGPHRVEVSVADKAGNRGNRLVWQFGVGESLVNKLEVQGKKLSLNGEPYFPIGIYSYQVHPGDGRFNETALAQAVDGGFDYVLNTTETRPGLDMLFKHGMRGSLNMAGDIGKCTNPADAKKALFEEGQGQFAKHPCTLGYWADDPEHAPKPEEMSKNAYDALRENDPDHPVFYAMSDMVQWHRCIANCDGLVSYRYPVPQYHPQMIYGWTLHSAFKIAGTKPVFFNSQAVDLGYGARFKSTEGFRPTPAEMRAMAYHALTHNIRGHSLYANYITEKKYPDHWREALKMASEMRCLAPVLAAGKPSRTASLKLDSTWASIYFRELEHDGAHTLITVNMSGGPVEATWQFKTPTRAIVLFEDRAMVAPSRTMTDLFKAWEVHVYRW